MARGELSRTLHALAALGVASCLLVGALLFFGAVLNSFASKRAHLAERAAYARELQARFSEAFAETKSQLESLGATPQHIGVLAHAEHARSFVEAACAAIVGLDGPDAPEGDVSCSVEETPITETISLHQAHGRFTGDPTSAIERLIANATGPISVSSIVIEGGSAPGLSTIRFMIEIAGARTEALGQ